jgi:hypothetical protein
MISDSSPRTCGHTHLGAQSHGWLAALKIRECRVTWQQTLSLGSVVVALPGTGTLPAGHWKGLGPGLLRSVLPQVGCANERNTQPSISVRQAGEWQICTKSILRMQARSYCTFTRGQLSAQWSRPSIWACELHICVHNNTVRLTRQHMSSDRSVMVPPLGSSTLPVGQE